MIAPRDSHANDVGEGASHPACSAVMDLPGFGKFQEHGKFRIDILDLRDGLERQHCRSPAIVHGLMRSVFCVCPPPAVFREVISMQALTNGLIRRRYPCSTRRSCVAPLWKGSQLGEATPHDMNKGLRKTVRSNSKESSLTLLLERSKPNSLWPAQSQAEHVSSGQRMDHLPCSIAAIKKSMPNLRRSGIGKKTDGSLRLRTFRYPIV